NKAHSIDNKRRKGITKRCKSLGKHRTYKEENHAKTYHKKVILGSHLCLKTQIIKFYKDIFHNQTKSSKKQTHYHSLDKSVVYYHHRLFFLLRAKGLGSVNSHTNLRNKDKRVAYPKNKSSYTNPCYSLSTKPCYPNRINKAIGNLDKGCKGKRQR